MSYADIVRGSFGGDRFTIISNLAARDARLSYKARGLLTAIASHREGWGITAERLAAVSPDGLAAVRSGLKELERFGYLRRYRLRDENGRLQGARWVITDDPDSLHARVAELAAQVGEEGMDLFERQPTRSTPKCDFPTLAEPTVAAPPVDNRTTKNTSHQNTSSEVEGKEEEGARGAQSSSPVDTPVDNGDDGWGIPDAVRPAPDTGTMFARAVIDGIAAETGLGLSPAQHRRLVLELLPAALDAVRALGDDAVSGTELVEWLRSDHDTTQSLYAILSTRCRPDYLTEALPVWVARTRTPGGLPAPSTPRPRREQAAPEDADPFTRAGAPPTCSVHSGIALTADATGRRTRCHQCEELPAPTAAPAPAIEDLADAISDALPGTEPTLPDHCGARECHQAQRRIIRYSETKGVHVDHGPCPRCHPNHAQESAA
ncbi:helix-turn-helix domain-containing protein [Nocardiopsis alba]|uniref:helix-turn-helix domain-containing protein n=1 Tax=Nocardiopsis alba TaxID=53437 RepID=UPI0036CA26BF